MKAIILTLVVALFSTNALALNCHGTEPFWGAEITDSKVKLSFAGDDENKVYVVQKVESALGFTEDYIKTYFDSTGPIAVVKASSCTDGMSDNNFGKEVLIFATEGVLFGCCGDAL